MSYNLFLDDERQPKNVNWAYMPLVEWTIAKSYDDFVRIVSSLGLPARVSFDHDLDEEHYREYHWAHSEMNLKKGIFQYDKMKVKTGYHCVQWLVKYCQERGQSFPEYYVHTMNPIGKVNIIKYIEDYQKSL